MKNQKLVHDTPSALTKNTFSKSGHAFKGWIAQKETDGSYYLADGTWSKTGTPYVFKDGEAVKDIGSGDQIKMIAQWIKYGDADMNEKLSVRDVTNIQMCLAKMVTFTENQNVAADVNGDSVVSIQDATTLQKYLAKIIATFPVG
jgi:hypothetical protein